MAFPIVAVITAALQDQQSRQAEAEAIRQQGQNNLQSILRRRASELGGSPYAMMAEDGRGAIEEIRRQAEASRNNQIGNLLQAYLKGLPSDKPEKFGESYESSFLTQPNLQYNASATGIGIGDAMGKSQIDPWDEDPWGDAGF